MRTRRKAKRVNAGISLSADMIDQAKALAASEGLSISDLASKLLRRELEIAEFRDSERAIDRKTIWGCN